jgi:hypothetical protein
LWNQGSVEYWAGGACIKWYQSDNLLSVGEYAEKQEKKDPRSRLWLRTRKEQNADRKKGLDQIRWKRLVSTYGLSVN